VTLPPGRVQDREDRACPPTLPPTPSAEQAASAPGSHDRTTRRAFPQHNLCSSTRSTRKFHRDVVQDLSSPRGAPPSGCFCQNPSDRNRNLVCITCFFLSEEIICSAVKKRANGLSSASSLRTTTAVSTGLETCRRSVGGCTPRRHQLLAEGLPPQTRPTDPTFMSATSRSFTVTARGAGDMQKRHYQGPLSDRETLMYLARGDMQPRAQFPHLFPQ